MKNKIVYDKPGRIRFRCGQYAFEPKHEARIRQALLKFDFITEVQATSANGGILILYRSDSRSKVIEQINRMKVGRLPEADSAAENLSAEIDRRFASDFFKILVKRILKKAVLPVPLSNAITVINGVGYFLNGIRTLLDFKLNVDVLDAASITACIAKRDFKTAGSVMFLLSISALLEDYTRAKTKASLTESLAVKTDKVWLVNGESEQLIPMSQLQVEDKIRIRTGSMIPVDGEIVEGQAEINESSMTGEPLAAQKSVGSSVFAGTTIENGNIVVKVRALSSQTKISKIVELIDNSEALKAGIQGRAENMADRIVPFSFIGFFAVLLLTRNITKAVSLLMVDYSCAIKLSVPISVISAIREASDCDITVKGGKFLEEYAKADTIVFDKTGTLTNAEPQLEAVIPFGGYSEDEVLKISACIEEHFPHSVARAIVKGAADKKIEHQEEHAEVIYIVAHGIATKLKGERVVIGSRHFVVEDENVEITEEQQNRIDEISCGNSVIYLAIGGKLVGALCISDPPRAESAEVVAMLRESGFKHIVMLTGDSTGAAKITAEKLGISEYYAQVLPEDKHRYIEDIKAKGHSVVMVGDGINDAPALAAASVSVAMSDASDIARDTADITLRGSSLYELVRLRVLSRRLMNRIKLNYDFIITFNSMLMALGLVGVITPSFSALLHNTSTMLICVKSMTPLLSASEADHSNENDKEEA